MWALAVAGKYSYHDAAMKARALLSGLIGSVLLAACASASPTSQEREPTPAAAPAPVAPMAPPATAQRAPELRVEHRADLGEVVDKTGFKGVFALLDPQEHRLLVSDTELLDARFPPASTFKIINTLIALDTGVADGPDFALPWDGKKRFAKSWNQDHTLVTAFRESAYWYYQELARRIGRERMAKWVGDVDYGNEDTGGAIDEFWLHGDLRISPREQIRFLQRLRDGELPFSARATQTLIDDVAVWNRGEGWTMWAKTGWAIRDDFPEDRAHVGWFVGWIETNAGTYYFASLLLASKASVDELGASAFRNARIGVVLTGLMKLGIVDAWPESLLQRRTRRLPRRPGMDALAALGT
jgi:beta-lactamase class D